MNIYLGQNNVAKKLTMFNGEGAEESKIRASRALKSQFSSSFVGYHLFALFQLQNII